MIGAKNQTVIYSKFGNQRWLSLSSDKVAAVNLFTIVKVKRLHWKLMGPETKNRTKNPHSDQKVQAERSRK